MKIFTTITLFCLVLSSYAQQASRKTFVIFSTITSPTAYNHISSVDINAGKPLEDIYNLKKKYSSRNNGYKSYERNDPENKDAPGLPMAGSVACLAYDYKTNRLFYIPQQLSELRYIDLKQSEPAFTYLENQSLNLLHNKEDAANQITRMTIGADGFGYALSNDGEHLVKFSTDETPVIQDLGVLIDNPKNTVMVRSSCTSWGGDIVGASDGSLYLVTVHNHVFKISLPSKKCDFVGTIQKLPEGFSSNGVSVDENGDMLVSCGLSLGRKFSPLYKIRWQGLEAQPVGESIEGLGNISDMASSNLLFQQNTKQENTTVGFLQTLEPPDNNLSNISIFPNPVTRGRFQIQTSNMKEKGEYKMVLLDATGNAVLESKMNLGLKTNTNSFSLPGQLPKGVYFIHIADVFNRTIYSRQLIFE